MPVKYDIIAEKNLIIVVGSGVVTANDIISHLDRLAENNSYTAPMKKLVDYRTIEAIKILPAEAELIAHRKKELATKFTGENAL